jgi:predicted RND superfamily exporter protein
VLLSFAAMGWLGIPLGVATSMFAGMTLGVGVDYSIHLLARYRRLHAGGQPQGAALAATLEAVGPALLIDAASVGLGFAVLLLSQVPVNARLGGLLVLCVGSCLAATLLIIPALVSLGPTASARAGSRP